MPFSGKVKHIPSHWRHSVSEGCSTRAATSEQRAQMMFKGCWNNSANMKQKFHSQCELRYSDCIGWFLFYSGYCIGFAWQGLGSRGAAQVAPVRNCWSFTLPEELQLVARTQAGQVHGELSPVSGTPGWSRGRGEKFSPWGRGSSRDNVQ